VKLTNKSSRSTILLNRLTAFVVKHYVHTERCVLNVGTSDKKDRACVGLATFHTLEGACSVNVGITKHAYPFKDPHEVLGVPAPTFDDADEEFIYVLAHELEHVDQFLTGQHRRFSAGFMEFRAERKAAQVLLAWRQRFRKPAIAPVDTSGAIAND
jgi:hypothetical protein